MAAVEIENLVHIFLITQHKKRVILYQVGCLETQRSQFLHDFVRKKQYQKPNMNKYQSKMGPME